MKSPRKPSSNLEKMVYNGIELDRCPETGGVWFDADELYELTSNMKRDDDFLEKFGGDWEDFGEAEAEGGCPRGHGKMTPFVVKKVNGEGDITLDICQKCLGIWVDGAELGMLQDVTLHNKENGGPPTIEPMKKNQVLSLVSMLNPMTWINKAL